MSPAQIKQRYVWVKTIPWSYSRKYQTILQVGVQTFFVGPEYDTRQEAVWFSSQLAKAISELTKVKNRKTKPHAERIMGKETK